MSGLQQYFSSVAATPLQHYNTNAALSYLLSRLGSLARASENLHMNSSFFRSVEINLDAMIQPLKLTVVQTKAHGHRGSKVQLLHNGMRVDMLSLRPSIQYQLAGHLGAGFADLGLFGDAPSLQAWEHQLVCNGHTRTDAPPHTHRTENGNGAHPPSHLVLLGGTTDVSEGRDLSLQHSAFDIQLQLKRAAQTSKCGKHYNIASPAFDAYGSWSNFRCSE